MPTAEQLGALAHPVVRVQPLIDPARIPQFALRDGSGLRRRRIAVWGDSHVAAGPFMPTVIDALRARGVTVGGRFLPPTMGRANVRLPWLRAYCIGPAWSSTVAYTAHERLEVGPGLIDRVAQAGPDSYLWLDLRAEPMVVSVPAVPKDRYYVMQWIDLFTQNFAYIGVRSTGFDAGSYIDRKSVV